MNIKLVIDGGDERVRIIPRGGSDKKLLEYIAEWDFAEVRVHRSSYGRDIEKIDLLLAVRKDGDAIKVPCIPEID